MRNLFNIYRDKNKNISAKFKKNFKANLIITDKEKNECSLSGRVRVNGDQKDHISIKEGIFISSMDIRIKDNLNPDLEIQGILLTMYDRRNKLSSQVEQEARDYFKDKVYQTVIPRNVRLSEAPSHGVPVLIYDKNCPGSKSYYNFTDEFINQESSIGSAA